MIYDLKGWTPPQALMESFASGSGVSEALATTQKSIAAYFGKMGAPPDKAAEAARSFTAGLSKSLASGVPPGEAIATVRNETKVVSDGEAGTAPAGPGALVQALARGENVQAALSNAAGKGAVSKQHVDAFVNTLQNAIAKGIDLSTALKMAESGVKAVDAAKLAQGPASAAAGLMTSLAGGGDSATLALKGATAGMAPDQAKAFLQTFQAAAASGADTGTALKLAGQAAVQQAEMAAAQSVPMSAADQLIAALANGGAAGLGRSAGLEAMLNSLAKGASAAQAAQAAAQAAEAQGRQAAAQAVPVSPGQAMMKALASGTDAGAELGGGGKAFAQALTQALASGADIGAATQAATTASQAAASQSAVSFVPMSPAAQLGAALASGSGAAEAVNAAAGTSGGDANAFANALSAVLSRGGDFGTATQAANSAATAAQQQTGMAGQGVSGDPTMMAMASGIGVQNVFSPGSSPSEAIAPANQYAAQLTPGAPPPGSVAGPPGTTTSSNTGGGSSTFGPARSESITFDGSKGAGDSALGGYVPPSSTPPQPQPVTESPPPVRPPGPISISSGHSTQAYVENDGAVVIDAQVSVGDPDKPVTGAKVKIVSNYISGEDVLTFADSNGITGLFDAATGELSLTGTAAASTYALALSHVTYTNTREDPSGAARTLKFSVTDDRGGWVSAEETVTVEPVNDAPVLSGTVAGAFTERGVPTAVVTNAGAADVDYHTTFNGGWLKAALTACQAGDMLSVVDGNGIAVVNGAVSYNSIAIGTMSGGTAGDLTIALEQAAATKEAVRDLMGQLRFHNTGDDPTVHGSANSRTVTITLDDGGNTGSGTSHTHAISGTINLTAENDAPTLAGTVGGTTYTEQGTPLSLMVSANLADVDGVQFNGGSVKAALAAYKTGDVLSVVAGNGITVDTGVVSFGGARIGTIAGGSAADLVVSLDRVAATEAAIEALMGQLSYSTISDDPTLWGQATTRDVTITVDDGGNTGGGGLTASRNGTITIAAVNDAPVLTAATPPQMGQLLLSQTDNPGERVSSLFETSIADPDYSNTAAADWGPRGIAVVDDTAPNGHWEYRLNVENADWTAFPNVSATSALLLDGDDYIRYVPGNSVTNATFDFRAWDETSGTHGTTANTGATGAGTAFSTATDQASLSVVANNPPIAVISAATSTLPFSIAAGNDPVGGLGGPAGYGSTVYPHADDASWNLNVAAAFPNGLKLGNTTYTASQVYVGSNGYITFGSGLSSFSPAGIAGSSKAMVAGMYNDINTARWPILGGSGDIYASVSSTTGVTVTYKDVSAYNVFIGGGDTFQIHLVPLGGVSGYASTDFGIEIRYDALPWGQYSTGGWTAGVRGSGNYGEVQGSGAASFTNNVSYSNLTPSHGGVYGWIVKNGVVGDPMPAVDESAAANTVVATLSTTRQVSGETYTYSLVDDAGGRFTIINGNQIVVASNADIDWAVNGTHTYTVTARSTGSVNSSDDVIATVAVTQAATDALAITGTAGGGTFTERDAAALDIVSAPVISDPRVHQFSGAKLTASLDAYVTGDTLSVAGGTGDLVTLSGTDVRYDGTSIGTITGDGVGRSLEITFTAAANRFMIQRVADDLRFSNATADPTAHGTDTSRVLTVAFDDGGNANSGARAAKADSLATGIIIVAGINDAPVNVVPGAQNATEDTDAVITGMSVSDVDAGTVALSRVTLSADHGIVTLAANSIADLGFSVGDGTADATMTFTGTMSAINAAIGSVTYRGNLNFEGADTIRLVTSDQGNSGSGGAQSDSDTIAVSVAAVDDAPTVANQNAAHFDGSDVLSATKGATGLSALTNTFTVEAWVKMSAPSEWAGIVTLMDQVWAGAHTGFKVLANSAGTVRLNIGNGSELLAQDYGMQNIADGKWHFLAASYDNNVLSLSVDGGTAVTSTVGSGKFALPTADLVIGNDPDAGGRQLIGDVAGLNIWNTARSAGQIAADMTHKLVGNESGLLASFHLDEASGGFADATSKNGSAARGGVTATDLDDVSVAHGTSYKGMVLGYEADHESLTYSLHGDAGQNGGATGGSVTLSGNAFTYTDTTGSAHSDSFLIDINDGHATTSHTINVTVS